MELLDTSSLIQDIYSTSTLFHPPVKDWRVIRSQIYSYM